MHTRTLTHALSHVLTLLLVVALVGCGHAPPPPADPVLVSEAAPAPLLPGECYAAPVQAPLLPEDRDLDDLDAAFDALVMSEALALANGTHRVCRAALLQQFGAPGAPVPNPVPSASPAPELGAHLPR
jgi:hypothetical protein